MTLMTFSQIDLINIRRQGGSLQTIYKSKDTKSGDNK